MDRGVFCTAVKLRASCVTIYSSIVRICDNCEVLKFRVNDETDTTRILAVGNAEDGDF